LKSVMSSFLVLLTLPFLSGCPGTLSAYRAAESLDDTAFVVAEHYAALVKEGNALRESGALTGSALTRAQDLEARARPIVLRLQQVSSAYEAVKSAENEAALSMAIDEAARVLSEFIDAIKPARDTAALEGNLQEVPA
jgi:hypothetical protein